MENTSFTLKTSDSLILKGIKWNNLNQPIAAVCIVHGFGEHQHRYTLVCQKLIEMNLVVFTYDQRGHGLSQGKRGHFTRFDLLLDDLDQVITHIQTEYPSLKIVLYAHSFGGNVGLNYLTGKHAGKISIGVITSPWITLTSPPPPYKLVMAKFAMTFIPFYSESSNLITRNLSGDPEIAKEYEEDPLVHDRISAAAYLEITKAGENLFHQIDQLNTPVLLAHGTNDLITDHKSSKKLATLSQEFIELKLWEGLKHETHQETSREEVILFYTTWIYEKLTAIQR